MKKQILALALLLTVSFSSIFANTNNREGVTERVMDAFRKDFASAQEVKWEAGKEYSKATFKMNEQVLFAYYTTEGNLLAVTRNMLSGQLPINLQSDLKKNYNGYWITDLFEMAANNETSYYVTLEGSDYNVVLKSTGINGWEVYKKDKKNAQ
ncbi:MAG: hypothetical protein QM731_18565 [Chitinophagaceae bacterium]